MKNRDYYLKVLYKATNIPFFICNNQLTSLVSCPDLDLSSFTSYIVAHASTFSSDIFSPVILTFPLCIYTGYIRLNENLQIIVGPVSSLTPEESQLSYMLQQFPVESDLDNVKNLLLYNQNASIENLIHTMLLIIQIYGNIHLTKKNFIIQDITYTSEMGSQNLTHEYFTNQELQLSHTPRDYESHLLSYIESGDFPGLIHFIRKPVPGTLGVLSYDHETNLRYHFIVSVAIACRTAIHAGANSEKAYSASDTFIRQMDASSICDNYEQLSYAMLKTYCDLVNASQQKSPEPAYVKICKHYISSHLHTQITLSDLSKICGYSERWLSKKFRDDTNESIIDYIQKEKLKEACRYLQYTSLSVSEISNFLGYSSQSYFNVNFKKYYHTTPQKFREIVNSHSSNDATYF